MGPRTRLPVAALVAAVVLMGSAVSASAEVSVRGNPARGKALFVRAGIFCSSCHILKAVKSTGRDGPNLDKRKPSYARIVDFVSNGRKPTRRWPTGMPRYAGQHGFLTKAQIRDVAAFVYTATHK